ncbi:unnamed protein product, partial [Thlaspi arvense]
MGKTSTKNPLLRRNNHILMMSQMRVKEGEAKGITRQIGATYIPTQNIRDRTRKLKVDVKLKVLGLLVIDTPGHQSFTNLRSWGLGLCDIAILVIDIMHGLEPQTIESINLLKMRDTKFTVALNKVDRLYGWKLDGMHQFGEGISDLLLWLVQWTLKTMVERLTYSNEVQGATIALPLYFATERGPYNDAGVIYWTDIMPTSGGLTIVSHVVLEPCSLQHIQVALAIEIDNSTRCYPTLKFVGQKQAVRVVFFGMAFMFARSSKLDYNV